MVGSSCLVSPGLNAASVITSRVQALILLCYSSPICLLTRIRTAPYIKEAEGVLLLGFEKVIFKMTVWIQLCVQGALMMRDVPVPIQKWLRALGVELRVHTIRSCLTPILSLFYNSVLLWFCWQAIGMRWGPGPTQLLGACKALLTL